MIANRPSRTLMKWVASAADPIPATASTKTWAETDKQGSPADFSLSGLETIYGMVQSELAGSLVIHQGVYDNKSGAILWVVKDTQAIAASTYSSGFVEGAGTRITPVLVCGEVFKITFKLTSGGPNNNFQLLVLGK